MGTAGLRQPVRHILSSKFIEKSQTVQDTIYIFRYMVNMDIPRKLRIQYYTEVLDRVYKGNARSIIQFNAPPGLAVKMIGVLQVNLQIVNVIKYAERPKEYGRPINR